MPMDKPGRHDDRRAAQDVEVADAIFATGLAGDDVCRRVEPERFVPESRRLVARPKLLHGRRCLPDPWQSSSRISSWRSGKSARSLAVQSSPSAVVAKPADSIVPTWSAISSADNGLLPPSRAARNRSSIRGPGRDRLSMAAGRSGPGSTAASARRSPCARRAGQCSARPAAQHSPASAARRRHSRPGSRSRRVPPSSPHRRSTASSGQSPPG